jgi:exodeoxyribonuclease-3
MRFMTWNIKTGGGDRLGAITRVIVRAAPDVLALQELRGFDAAGARRLHHLADTVGMTPHLAPSLLGQPVAVLVRPPGRIAATWSARWPLHHAAAAVTVGTDRGPLTVVSTHLNPFSPRRRLREARWLVARYGPAPARFGRGTGWTGGLAARVQRMIILAGDLNALDPWTEHRDRIARLPPRYRKRHLRPDGTPDTRTIAAFDAAGLTDLWRAAGSAGPAGAGLTVPTTQGGGAEFSGMRLDYVLGSPPVVEVVVSAGVVRGGEAEYASDHYPVTMELALRLTGP